MFSWELPPKIFGGLGIACQGILQALAETNKVDVTLVLPRLYGGEDMKLGNIVSASAAKSPLHSDSTTNSPQESSYNKFGRYTERGKNDFLSQLGGITNIEKHRLTYDSSVTEVLKYANNCSSIFAQLSSPDIIHAHDWLTVPAALAAQRFYVCPLVFHVHSTEFDRAGRHPNHSIIDIEHMGLLAANVIIAVSEVTRQTLIQRYSIAASRIVVIHNSANVLEPLVPILTEKSAPLISFIGRVTHQKGPRYFIEAAKIVLAHRPDAKFVMAGNGDLLPMAKALATTLSIREHFEFPGFLDPSSVAKLLASSSAYVMPSVAEPFGIGALEAALAGVPTIITDCCGVKEVLGSIQTVPAGDSDAIASAIMNCLINPEIAAKRAASVQEIARKSTWIAAAKSILEVYETTQMQTLM